MDSSQNSLQAITNELLASSSGYEGGLEGMPGPSTLLLGVFVTLLPKVMLNVAHLNSSLFASWLPACCPC